jgi:hypothetical protein
VVSVLKITVSTAKLGRNNGNAANSVGQEALQNWNEMDDKVTTTTTTTTTCQDVESDLS